MPFPGPKSQWKHAAFLILSFLIFIILLLNATRLRSASIYPIEGRNEGLTTQNVTDHAHVDAAIALGSESSKDPLSLLQELEGKNRFLKKRAPTLSYESALCKGRNALQVIHQGNPNPPKFTQQDLEDGGWLTDEDFPRVIPDDLKTAVSELKISSNSDDIHRISVSQFLEFTTQNGKRNDVSRQACQEKLS